MSGDHIRDPAIFFSVDGYDAHHLPANLEQLKKLLLDITHADGSKVCRIVEPKHLMAPQQYHPQMTPEGPKQWLEFTEDDDPSGLDIYDEIVDPVLANNSVIQGSPGTGKNYLLQAPTGGDPETRDRPALEVRSAS